MSEAPFDLRFFALQIPMRVSFKHGSATRATSCSVWVEAQDTGGLVGYGEGCPREYVSGEDLGTAQAFYQRHHREWQQLAGPPAQRVWVEAHQAEIDRNPAAWCAVELALLDLWSRQRACSWEALLGLEEVRGPFHYSAVLGDQDGDSLRAQLRQYLGMGFTQFKLKLSGDRDRDLDKQAALIEVGVSSRALRWDANNLWPDAELAAQGLRGLQGFALEEPLSAGDLPGLRALARDCDRRIILDESVLRLEQLEGLREDPDTWIVNLRVSKMGGLWRSRQVALAAGQAGISLVIGAQVGETSVLTRAAWTIAQSHRDQVLAQEGAFGTLLLQSDVLSPPRMFGAAGRLQLEDPASEIARPILPPAAFLSPLPGRPARGD